MYFFEVKSFLAIFLIWIITFAKGVPDDYEQRLQPRSIGDWFYGDNSDSDPSNSKTAEDISNENKTKVIPLDEAGLNHNPEPIENLLKKLKEKADKESMDSKSVYKEDKNITSLLKDLNKTLTDTPTKLVKVFVNKTWRIFDIGALGSSRRTRNVNETTYLGSVFDLFSWFTQLLAPVYPYQGVNQGNTVLHQPFNTIGSLTRQDSSKISKVQPGQLERQNSSRNTEFKVIVNKENRNKAERFYNAKTEEEVISKVKKSLRSNLNTQDQFYILLALDKLYDRLYKIQDNETKLDLIYLVISVRDDRRFKELFEALQSSKNREDKLLWQFFQNDRTKYDRIRSIKEDIREKKVTEEPLPENCLITGPPKEVSERGEGENKRTVTTYYTWKVEHEDNYYKLCIDDNSETEANNLLKLHNDETVDNVLKSIRSHLRMNSSFSILNSSPKMKWFIILKLYKMFENTGSNSEDDKKNIVELMTLVGTDRKFDRMFESLQAAKNPIFHKIWEAFKNNPQVGQDSEKGNVGNPFKHLFY